MPSVCTSSRLPLARHARITIVVVHSSSFTVYARRSVCSWCSARNTVLLFAYRLLYDSPARWKQNGRTGTPPPLTSHSYLRTLSGAHWCLIPVIYWVTALDGKTLPLHTVPLLTAGKTDCSPLKLYRSGQRIALAYRRSLPTSRMITCVALFLPLSWALT